jgi:uncharacterized membrane protein YphA (DoxX/SURF4 family)
VTSSLLTPSVTERLLSAYRFGLGALFTAYGAGALLGAGGAWWVAAAEVLTGLIVLLGARRTRGAAVLCAILVLVAGLAMPSAATVWPVRLGGAATVLLCWGLLLIGRYGPGYWTLEQVRMSLWLRRELAIIRGMSAERLAPRTEH